MRLRIPVILLINYQIEMIECPKEALRHRGNGRVLLEASLDRDVTVPRVNVDHSDVTQYCATVDNLACRFGAEGPEVRIVRFERVEEIVARLDRGEREGWRDQGRCWYGGVAFREDRLVLVLVRGEETGEDC